MPILLLTSCRGNNNEVISNNIWAFGTMVSIKIQGGSKEILSNALELAEKYSKLSDAYNSWSGEDGITPINNLCLINLKKSEGKPIEVDPLLTELLTYGINMKEETSMVIDGEKQYFFDPLIGDVTTLWKTFVENESKKEILPTNEQIDASLNDMRNSSITVEGNTITRNGNAIIDVGAYAKGYAVNKIREYLISEGIKVFSINAGSSSLGLGTTENDMGYRIHIDRETKNGHFSAYYLAKNTSVGTSGVSEQGREYEGKVYSHIVDPRNGSGEAKYDTVSVKTTDSGLADILSTVIFIGGDTLAKYLSSKYDFGYMIFDGKDVVASNDKLGLVVENK